jgi:hypothetical protein
MPSAALPASKNVRSWRHTAVYVFVGLCWVAYLVLTFSQPTESGPDSPYKLSDFQLRALQLTIAIPYLLIWLAAFHGALQIRTYQTSLAEGEHSKAFKMIFGGLAWLAVGLLATTIVGAFRNMDALQGFESTLVVVNNFLYVLFPLVGFSHLFVGSNILAREAGVPLTASAVVSAVLVAGAIAAAQLYLIFTDPARLNTYHLSDPLLVGTIVLPTAASLVLCVITAFNLRGFLKKSAAIIYEKSFPPLTTGLTLIMASTIVLQLLLSLGQSRLLGIGLGGILVLVYAFLALQGAGYMLVASGTSRLAKLHRTLAKYRADVPLA